MARLHIRRLSTRVSALVAAFPLLTGCHADQTPPVDDVSAISKPPGAYPANTLETTILADLRTHLDGIVAQAPHREVLAYIFVTKPIDEKTFEHWFLRYDLRGGAGASVQVLRDPSGVVGEPLPEGATTSLALRAHLKPLFESLPDPATEGASMGALPSEVRLGSMAVWGSAADIDRLWADNAASVRGVAVLGTRGHVVHGWRAILPGERIR